jgi:hypothetical protein
MQVVHVGVLVAENEREVQRLRESRDVRPLDNCVIGTPEQVAKTLRAIVRQGASRLTVHFADAPRPDGTLLFGVEVIPLLLYQQEQTGATPFPFSASKQFLDPHFPWRLPADVLRHASAAHQRAACTRG